MPYTLADSTGEGPNSAFFFSSTNHTLAGGLLTTAAYSPTRVDLLLYRVGSPTGALTVYLYDAETSGADAVPDDRTAIATATLDVSTIGEGVENEAWYPFYFDTPPAWESGKTYTIVAYQPGSDGSSNYISWRRVTFTTGSEGVYLRGTGAPGASNDASNWSTFDTNGSFSIRAYTGSEDTTMSGTADGSATATGALGGVGSLAGAVAGVGAAVAALGGVGDLSGAVAASSAATGTLTGAGSLSGASAGSATATATLAASGALVGSAAASAAVTGTLTADGALAGSSAGVASVSGSLSEVGSEAMSGSTAGSSTVSGTLGGAGTLAGSAAGVAGVSGSLSSVGAMIGSADGLASVTGTMSGVGSLAGNCAGAATVTATLSGAGLLSGSIAAATTVTGSLGGAAPVVLLYLSPNAIFRSRPSIDTYSSGPIAPIYNSNPLITT